MAGGASDRVWLARARWRLRGASQWPALWVLTVIEALLLHLLPFTGEGGANLVAAFLICGFGNLVVVAVLGPALGAWRHRHRPRVPRIVAADRAATTLMAAAFLALLAGGIAHRPSVKAADRDADAQLAAARRWFGGHADAQFRTHLGQESVWKQAPGLYRTCVRGDDPGRDLCVFVDTTGPAPAVTEDPDQRPNSYVAGPDNPGRRSG